MKLFLCALGALLLTAATSHAVPVTVRVVDANGQAVAGARVEIIDYADVTDDKTAVPQTLKTAADGTLKLDLRGVPERENETVFVFRARGQHALGNARVSDPKTGYGILALTAGENALTLQKTVSVAGTIRDAKGAPLPGARVKLLSIEKSEQDSTDRNARYGQAPVVTTTKADGTWEFADLPRGYAQFLVEASGAADDALDFQIADSPTRAPDLKLRDAGIVRGRIVDFQGQPVTSAYAFLDNDYGGGADTDAQGRFELPGVPVGESKLRFSSMAPNWTGVSGEYKATIPAKGAIVDIGDVRADEGLLVSGLVVDDVTKAPVAGVKLKLDIWDTILETDAQGRFETRVQKKFYGLKVQGDYNQKTVVDWSPDDAKKFDVGTIEVERLGAMFSGRITDEKGAPLPNVRMGWNNSKTQFDFITPDANGNFKIENLPYKPLQIFVGDGARFLAATATPDTPIELKLPPATAPLSDAEIETLWEQLKIRRISDLGRYTEALGARRVFETARRFDAATNPTQIGQGLDDYLSDRAREARTPAEREAVAREGVEWLRRFDVAAWSLGMGEIAMLAAQTEDDELRDWAARWYDAQKTRVRQPDSADKLEWYHGAFTKRVMSVGAALGRDDATAYRDIWLSQIDKPHEQNLRQYLPEWGETLWRANPQWFDEIVGTWPAPEQMRAIVGALQVEENPARAKALLARLEKLATDPAPVAADAATSDTMSPISKSVEALYQGRTNFARSMALVDAPAALDALDQVQAVIQSSDVYAVAAIIARAAIAQNQPEIARRALKLGLRDSYTDGSGAPTLALIARPFDAELSAQLMEVARKNATPYVAHIDPIGGWRDVATYAIALREFDAGAGRLLLEKSWAELPQTFTVADAEHLRSQRIVTQEKLAWAMAFYDVPRALQWLGEIKDDRDEWNNGLERTRLAILVAALTPPERRYLLLSATYF